MSNPLKDLRLSLEELKAIAEIISIKGCKSMSKGKLLRALTPSKPAKKSKKPKANFSKARTEEIKNNLVNRDINFLN